MTEKQSASPESEKKGVKHVAWGIAIVLLFVLAFGVIVQLLWNWLMPGIFGLRTITFPQAIGLLLLSRLLFGRVGQRRDHAGYLTGKYGFRNLFGRGCCQESASNDVVNN
jgi:hypothetical protein